MDLDTPMSGTSPEGHKIPIQNKICVYLEGQNQNAKWGEVSAIEALNVAGLKKELKRALASKIFVGNEGHLKNLDIINGRLMTGKISYETYRIFLDILCASVDVSLKAVKKVDDYTPAKLDEVKDSAIALDTQASLVSVLQAFRVTGAEYLDAAYADAVRKSFSENIWIFVSLRTIYGAKISQSDFVQLKPPRITYLRTARSKSHQSTQSDFRRKPYEVTEWTDFDIAVRGHKLSKSAEYEPPIFRTYTEIADELDVQAALRNNMLDPLSEIIGSKLNKPAKFARHSVIEGIIEGQPDFVFYEPEEESQDFPYETKDAILLFPNKVKIEWVLRPDDIVNQYNNDLKGKWVERALAQIQNQ